MTLPLSVYIIARNEADRIGPAIESVREISSDCVVVLDGQSTDDTAGVAARAGARVATRPWTGFGEQKYFAEEQCAHDWVLCLDADERVTPALADEIRAVLAAPKVDFYEIRIVDVYPGAIKPRLWAKPVTVVRLFRKSKGRTNQSAVHDRVDVPAGAVVARLTAPIHHYSIRSLGHLIKKYDDYTTLQAETMNKSPRWLAVRLFTEYPMAFIQYFLLHRHLTGGLYGYAVSRVLATARWHRIVKMWEKSETKK